MQLRLPVTVKAQRMTVSGALVASMANQRISGILRSPVYCTSSTMLTYFSCHALSLSFREPALNAF